MILLLSACAPGAFTLDEWAHLEAMALPDELPRSEVNPSADDAVAAALGEALYLDPEIALPVPPYGTVSCNTCHQLFDGEERLDHPSGADPRGEPTSAGAAGVTGRTAPSVVNTAFQPVWGWAGRYCDMPGQIRFAFESTSVYGLTPSGQDTLAPAAVAERIRAAHADTYVAAFGDLPEDDAVVYENASFALEALLRTVIEDDTPLDALLAGDDEALSAARVRGAGLFVGKAHCVDCHSGPLLSDGEFHHVGAGDGNLGRGEPIELCGEADPATDAGKFRTPSLRGVARTAPYMHDGSIPSLWEVILHYDQGGRPDSPVGEQDPRIKPLNLTDAERRDLEAFLFALGEP